MLVIFNFTACDKDDKSNHLPLIWDILLQPEEDFYLIVEFEQENLDRWLEVYISFLSKDPIQAVYINNAALDIYEFDWSNVTGYYNYDLYLWNYNEILGNPFDQEISYKLVYANKTVTGSLKVPSRPVLSDYEFDPNNDLTINWQLTNNPKLQELWVRLNDWDNYATYYKKLSKTTRNHTVPKTIWAIFDDIIPWTSAEISAFNYKYQSGGMICYISSDDIGSGDKQGNQRPAKDRIKQILNKEIVLPK
jgi:hypothetical protein